MTSYTLGRPIGVRLLIALGIVALCIGLRVALLPQDAGYPYATLYPAMILCFLLCGSSVTAIAWACSVAAAHHLFVARPAGLPPDVKGHLATAAYLIYVPLIGAVIRATRVWQYDVEQGAARQRAIVESPLLGVATTRNRHYVWANPALEEMLGYPAGGLAGLPTRRFYADEDAYHGFAETTHPPLAKGDTYRGEMTLVRRDGQHIRVAIAGTMLDPSTDEAVWVVTDITARKQAEADLRATKSLLDRTSAIAGIGGWQWDTRGDTLIWTDECFRLFGYPASLAPLAADASRLCAPHELPRLRAVVDRAVTEHTGWDIEIELRRHDGAPFWARMMGGAEYREDQSIRITAAIQDIGEQRALRQALADNHEFLKVTLEAIADAVITTDADGAIIWLNPVAERLTGWTTSTAQGRPVGDICVLVNEETHAQATDFAAACLAAGACVHTPPATTLTSRDGTQYAIEGSASPLRDAQGARLGAVLVFHDVSTQRKIGREMTYRATHDLLTGLANRAEFEARVAGLLARATTTLGGHALLFLDLDQFKLVNDSCGHVAGDQLLCQIAALLRQSVRSADCVARLGGDEFGVLLQNCDTGQALRIGRKICDQIDRFRFAHGGKRFRVGASVGLVAIDGRWATPDALHIAADSACYAAKAAGGNRIHVWVESDAALATRTGDMQWINRLQQALDDDEFVLFAQRIVPIDPAQASTFLHAELLLRLRQPDGSLISPMAFLPTAERFSMATQIDRWVLNQIFNRLNAGGEADEIDTLAINLSGQSISDDTFQVEILAMIDAAEFDVSKLCLEITETAAITHFAEARHFISLVRARGVRIALDDFGAGASSFGYLKNLPVDCIKIDGQFVRGLLDDRLDQVAIRCFVDLAQAMGVKSVAEYIENAAVLAALRDIGVDFAQGFYLHVPEPLERLLQSRKQAVLF